MDRFSYSDRVPISKLGDMMKIDLAIVLLILTFFVGAIIGSMLHTESCKYYQKFRKALAEYKRICRDRGFRP